MFVALLDACVLVPVVLRDTLLYSADAGLYLPRWSERILAEVGRSLVVDRNLRESHATDRVGAIGRSFPEAMVQGFEPLIDSMTNDVSDRHVLAAAVHAGAPMIVTDNTKDFPTHALAPLRITALSSNEFLTLLFDTDPGLMRALLVTQAAGYHSPPLTFARLLAALELHAPTFVARFVEEDL